MAMRRALAPLLVLVMALPAKADLRPMPRPAAIAAFAGATDLALRSSPRPRRNPEIVSADVTATAPILPVPLVIPAAAGYAGRPFSGPGLAVDPGLRAAMAARRSDVTVTTSASNAPHLPDVSAAARAAFVPVPGPALQPRPRPATGDLLQGSLPLAPRLRPVPRPDFMSPATALTAVAASAAAVAPQKLALITPRPAKRPAGLLRRDKATEGNAGSQPEPQPEVIRVATLRVRPGEQLLKPKKGSVCGDRKIRGETIPPIPARVKGCGLADPVRVNEIDGVRLSPSATIDCSTAKALKTWIANGLKPAAGKQGVSALRVAASYACRPRNNIPGARISEHGRGKAIDISAVVLGNGEVIDVLGQYHQDKGRVLRAAHKAACGIFGTTLGPGSDGYHENHLHFDTASYRGEPYCR